LKSSTSNKNETNKGLAKMLDPSVNRKDLQQNLLRVMALTFRNKLL